MKITDRIISLFFMIFCGLYYYMSFSFSEQSRGFPHFMIFCLFIFSLWLFIITFKKEISSNYRKEIKTKKKLMPLKLLFVIFFTVIYLFLISKIGFYFMTIVYLLTIMYFLGLKNFKFNILISIFTVILIYISFNILLQIRMPEGILF